MADTLIFKIDTTPTVSALQDVNDLLTQSKTKLKELTDAGKTQTDEYIAQTAVVKAYEKEQRSLNNVLVQQQGAIKVMTKLTEENIKAGKAENNSIAENRKAYNALYNQLLQTAKPTKEQIKTAKELNTVLKEQEAALGNTSRNVGNYGQGFSEITGKIGSLIPGLKGFSEAQSGINAAFAANPVLGFVTALRELFNLISGNKEVMDALEQATAFVSAAFSVVVDRIVQFGKSLVEVLSNPKQLIADFGQLIQDNLTNRFKAFGLIIDAIASGDMKKLGDAFFQLGTGVTDISGKVKAAGQAFDQLGNDILKVATANAQAAKAQQDLDDAIRASNEQQAEQEVQIYRLIKASKDKTKSDEERIKLAKQALKLEEDRAEEERKIADQQVKILEQQFKGLQLTDEQEDKLSQARVKRSNALRQTLVLQEKIQNDLNALEQELADEKAKRDAKKLADEKAVADQKAKEANDEKARLEKQAADEAKAFNDKIAYNQKQLQLDLNAVDLSVETEKEKARLKAEIQLAALEEQLKLTKQFLGPEGSLTKEQLQGIKAIEQAIAMAKNNLKPKEGDPTVADALGINEEGIEKAQETLSQISKALQAVTDIVNAGFETRLNNIDATKNAEIDAINQSTASEEDKAKKIQEIEREAAMARYDIELKQFQANKATSIIQTIINTAQAVMAQLLAPPPAGFIFAGLAAATGAAQLALIASQPAPPRPAFATGVIGLDGAGTATSDSIDARLSRGESVMTAKATERFAPVLAQMELAVGNRPNFQLGNSKFATGYIPTTDGGYSDRAMSNEVNNASTMAKMFSDSIAKMPQPKLVYDEFTNFVNNRNQSVNLSEL